MVLLHVPILHLCQNLRLNEACVKGSLYSEQCAGHLKYLPVTSKLKFIIHLWPTFTFQQHDKKKNYHVMILKFSSLDVKYFANLHPTFSCCLTNYDCNQLSSQ